MHSDCIDISLQTINAKRCPPIDADVRQGVYYRTHVGIRHLSALNDPLITRSDAAVLMGNASSCQPLLMDASRSTWRDTLIPVKLSGLGYSRSDTTSCLAALTVRPAVEWSCDFSSVACSPCVGDKLLLPSRSGRQDAGKDCVEKSTAGLVTCPVLWSPSKQCRAVVSANTLTPARPGACSYQLKCRYLQSPQGCYRSMQHLDDGFRCLGTQRDGCGQLPSARWTLRVAVLNGRSVSCGLPSSVSFLNHSNDHISDAVPTSVAGC